MGYSTRMRWEPGAPWHPATDQPRLLPLQMRKADYRCRREKSNYEGLLSALVMTL